MIHLGDITRIDGRAIPPVDAVTGGSPCQDLSVAGKRAGLAGERSGLYMEQIRIIKEMREEDRRRGRADHLCRPRFMVWENVPGALSSNRGADFGAVLTEAVRVAEPEAADVPVPEKGWPTSGCLYDELGRWSLAWRIHDARFWGVPQRRRRIALVCDFGGLAAPEILFERQGVSGDIDPGKAEREALAAGAGGGAAGTVTAFHLTQDPITSKEVTPCLSSGNPIHGQATIGVLCLNDQGGSVMDVSEEVAGTLRAQEHGHQPAVFENHGQDSRLTGPLDVAPTVAQTFGTGGNNTPLVVSQQRFGEYREGIGTLTAHNGTRHTGETLVVTGLDCRNGMENPELSVTIQAKANGGQSLNCTHPICDGKTVRRLTPLECERLQGFPDGWTDIGPWVDSKGKFHKESSDSARYKALGNSIALPFWKWLSKRISALYERDATLGSLFDGIGGFPLCWERVNGPGSCLWASEIEEFPMAVTRFHFGEEAHDGQ